MNAGVVIYSILSGSPNVTALVGSGDNCRVYPIRYNSGYDLPYITYQHISKSPNPTKTGPSTLDEDYYQLNIVAATPLQARDLAAKVRTALDYVGGVVFTGGTLQQSYMVTERDYFLDDAKNDGVCMIQQDYRLLIVR
jgi:hypothetical protein